MRQLLKTTLVCSASVAVATHAWAQTGLSASTQSEQIVQPAASKPAAKTSSANSQPVATSQGVADSGNAPAAAEVVVTAQKRVERVQDVPVAVTVVSSQQLQREQITQLTDLNRAVPSLEFSSPGFGPGGGGIVRGIGTAIFSETAEPSVAVVVDGVNQFNANIGNLFDVARVEVLEGPQGTLFGQSVSAGVINITTPTPDPNRLTAYIHSQLSANGFMGSDYGRQVVQGMLNLPVTSDSALRIAASFNHTHDIQNNSYTHKGDDTSEETVRARYYWHPSSDLRINIIGDYDNARTAGGDFVTYRQVPAGSPIVADLAACGVTASDTNSTNCGSFPEYIRSTVYGISGQIDYDILGDTVTSISSYRKRIAPSASDVSGFPFGQAGIPLFITNGPSERNSDYFTQEVRLASPSTQFLEYTLGAFYSRYESIYQNPSNIIFDEGGTPFVNSLPSTQNTSISSEAIFGQLTWHLTHQLRLITGGRLTRDSVVDNLFDASQTPNDGGLKVTVENASWRLGAQYDVNRNLMGYVTVSRGFKGPQINDATLATGVNEVKPELPQNYEVGIKSTVLDGRLGVSTDVFYEVVHDFQSEVCVPHITNTGVNTGELCQPANVPRVITKGVEGNAFGRPLPGLTVNAGFIYDPAEYPKGYIATDGTNVGGEQLAFSSKAKVTLSGNYEHPIDESHTGFVAINATWRSQQYLFESSDPNYLYPAYWNLGGEIGVRFRQGFKVSVFGQNLTDRSVPAIIFPGQFSGLLNSNPSYLQYITAASRRTVGISLDANF